MAKIAQTDIETEGFNKKSFGGDMTDGQWSDYLAPVIADAALETLAAAGDANYAAASGTLTFSRVKRAELCHAAQTLFGRLEVIAERGRYEPGAQQGSPLIASRDRYRAEFDAIMLRLGCYPVFSEDSVSVPGSVVSESSHFAEDQT